MSEADAFDAVTESRDPDAPLSVTVSGVDFLIPAAPPWAWIKFSAKATDESIPEDDRVTYAEMVRAVESLFSHETEQPRDDAPKPSAGKKVWAAYAETIGVIPPDDATRDMIRAACSRRVRQLDEFDALGLSADEVAVLLLFTVPATYQTSAGNSGASDAA